MKRFFGPGGYYIKDSDCGEDPFADKLMDDPFDTTRFNYQVWDKPSMRSQYREINRAHESLSPKEFAGAGELYEDYMYAKEAGRVTREDPYQQPKQNTENEVFGMKKKESKSKKEESSSKKRRGFE